MHVTPQLAVKDPRIKRRNLNPNNVTLIQHDVFGIDGGDSSEGGASPAFV
jgi:hypothetical protein